MVNTPFARCVLIDTKAPQTHAGAYCAARRAWLARSDAPVIWFMHHPPFDTGIAAMDKTRLQEAELFYHVVAPHVFRIRHLLLGHVRRAIFGNWRGISFCCMRGLNHKVALGLGGGAGRISGNFEPPAYGVVLLGPDQVTVHLHDF